MARSSIPDSLQIQVRERAKHLCEYCHAAEKWQYVPFTIDHVIPVSKEGSSNFANLALACFHCNRRKSNQISIFDFTLKKEISLFNPRTERWGEHFIWSKDGLKVLASSAIGHVTIEALQLNRERVLRIRAEDVIVKRHPPKGDLIQS